LAVSAYFEGSAAKGINGNQDDDSIPQAGAVYVFTRDDDTWSQQAYLKASNTGEAGRGDELGDGDQFGFSLTLSDDGDTLAVSAITEDSGAAGIDGDQSDNSQASAGAVYLFSRAGSSWTQQAYIKPTNPGGGDMFGYSVSLTADGNMLAVSGFDEDGSLASTNEQQDDDVRGAGAVYVFTRIDDEWEQTAYLKASNAEPGDSLGVTVAISDDGNTLVAASLDEDSVTTGINSTPVPDRRTDASTGAVYVFVRNRGTWSQQAYIKASNTSRNDWFGSRLTLSGDGDTLAVGAQLEDSAAQGINASQDDETAQEAGAVYLFTRDGTTWTQTAYVKGSNTEAYDEFGSAVALSRDGALMAVGARGEDSAATGIDGEQIDNSAYESGAVYLFSRADRADAN
ncbi:MAG: integrin, partial [Gammaproteobacteria bacterium]